jgi:aspartate-semialdehyde dehydrogenase
MVGQRLVAMLAHHPFFDLRWLAASDRSVGRPYREAVHWLLPSELPASASELEVLPADPDTVVAELVFSALDAAVACETEASFRAAGAIVVSNASSFRQDPEVPLVIPEINADHLALVTGQRRRHGGAIATNPNCSTIGLCLSLEPLRRAFGISEVIVTTLQAASGAGYPGVASLDLVDNVLPEIAGEEAKLLCEAPKIFGRLVDDRIEALPLTLSAQCNRVPVRDGHLMSVSVRLRHSASLDTVGEAIAAYTSPLADLGLPSAPPRPVVLERAPVRPQPVLDRDRGFGMTVTVGRVQRCPVLGLRYVALVHNTVRGAAGGTLLIAELLAAEGYLDRAD